MDDEVLTRNQKAPVGATALGRARLSSFRSGAAELDAEALRKVVEHSPQGIAVVDSVRERCVYMNPAGRAALGRSWRGVLGSAPAFLLAPYADAQASSPFTAVLGTRLIEYSATGVRVSDRELRVVHFRDVTRSRQRERHLAAFNRTSASIAFAGPLSTVLDRLADEVRLATGMSSCTFLLMDDDGNLRQAGMGGHGYPGVPDYAERLEACRDLGAPLLSLSAFTDRRAVVAPGWRQTTLSDPRFAPLHDITTTASWNTLATVPVISRGNVIGVLNGFYDDVTERDEEDRSFLTAIADQAAVAVENARLVGAMESKAALDERHLLARDLHDSVNQALFSMTLQARALEVGVAGGLLTDDSVGRRLAEVRELTEGALAEMRALIFQLRPSALREEGLVSAVRKHAAAVAAREGLKVRIEAQCDAVLMDSAIEEQVFRVVQEALHNIVKHAGAAHVRIAFAEDPHHAAMLEVVIDDDGKGFDVAADYPGHLGLQSMAERIAQISGTFNVSSRTGATRIRARVPLGGATISTETLSHG